MQVVCEATQAVDLLVKVAACQCLVKIMSLYYHFMEAYMGPALFAITLESMKSPDDEVALQGIEFWSSVCDEEVDLQIEAQEAQACCSYNLLCSIFHSMSFIFDLSLSVI